jgi:hypothetical protein
VRLDVAVHHAASGRVAECARRLGENAPHLGGRQRPTRRESIGKRLAAQQLHDEVDDLPAPSDAVDGDDMRVLELRRDAALALEALDEALVECELGRQDLDGDVAIQPALTGAIDDRHPAAADLLEDVVIVRECRANRVELRLPARGGGRHRRVGRA